MVVARYKIDLLDRDGKIVRETVDIPPSKMRSDIIVSGINHYAWNEERKAFCFVVAYIIPKKGKGK